MADALRLMQLEGSDLQGVDFAELARASGLSLGTIRRFAFGMTHINNLDRLEAIADALDETTAAA